MFSAGETVTVIRPAARDEFGDRIAGSGNHTIEGCAIIQQSTSKDNARLETADRRETSVTIIELLCPPGADIKATDRVQIGDTVYQVDGQPWTPHNPFTAWEPGVNVRLRGVQ